MSVPDKAVTAARMAEERGVRMLAARAELALMRRRGRGCTCADPVYHPDPNCGECAGRIQRRVVDPQDDAPVRHIPARSGAHAVVRATVPVAVEVTVGQPLKHVGVELDHLPQPIHELGVVAPPLDLREHGHVYHGRTRPVTVSFEAMNGTCTRVSFDPATGAVSIQDLTGPSAGS